MSVVNIERCVATAVARMKDEPGPLLEILHSVQDELGFVPPEAIPLIADALNLSRAEVHGVVSFYHHFRSRPSGRHVLKLCHAEACQSMNGAAVVDLARRRFGCDIGETTADGSVTLEAVYCLGLCAVAPAAMLDNRPIGCVGADHLERIASECGVQS